jgi:hypothetical protein
VKWLGTVAEAAKGGHPPTMWPRGGGVGGGGRPPSEVKVDGPEHQREHVLVEDPRVHVAAPRRTNAAAGRAAQLFARALAHRSASRCLL